MNDDQILLASAYLDDDVDDAERMRAEADPEVMAEVARLRDLRRRLRDVEAPDADRRDRSIDAALAAFGHETAPIAAPSRPMPRPQRARRAWWGGVAAAAAALVVVVAGAVAIRGAGGGGGDDDSASVATDLGDLSDVRDETMAAAPSADAGGGSAPAATEQEAGDAAGAPDDTSATAATTNGSYAASTQLAAAGPTLADSDALAAYASLAADSSRESAGTATCTEPGEFVGPATYAGTPVEVFVDGDTATAVDATTCELVDVVALTR